MSGTIVTAGFSHALKRPSITFRLAKGSHLSEKFPSSNELVKFGKTFLLA